MRNSRKDKGHRHLWMKDQFRAGLIRLPPPDCEEPKTTPPETTGNATEI
jgi:hypothetical protein